MARIADVPCESALDDGEVMDPNDVARQWLIDNGLYYDTFGMPLEQYEQYPTSTRYRGPR